MNGPAAIACLVAAGMFAAFGYVLVERLCDEALARREWDRQARRAEQERRAARAALAQQFPRSLR